MSTDTKIKRPTEREYQRARIATALDYAPRIYPCAKCGWPVVDGYCCSTCGDTNPSEPEEEAAPQVMHKWPGSIGG